MPIMLIENLFQNRLPLFIVLLLLFLFGLFIAYSSLKIKKQNKAAAVFVFLLGSAVTLASTYLMIITIIFGYNS